MTGSAPPPERLPERTVPAFLAGAVAQAPDHPFLVEGDGSLTYAELDALSNRAAHVWLGLGVGRGDRVLLFMENCTDFYVAWFGLAKTGAVLVAANPRFKADELAHLAAHSGSRAVLVDDDRFDVAASVRAAGPGPRHLLSTGARSDGPSWHDLLAAAPDTAPAARVLPDDVLSLIYTSGTTGTPKAVMQTHRNYVLTGEAYASWLRMTAADRAYVCLPLSHVNAQAYSTMGVIAARATIVLAPRFSASAFWSDVRGHRVTMFNFIGAMLAILAKSDPSPQDAQNELRVAYSGSVAGLEPARRRALEERYGLRLLTGFGMSETTFGFIEPYDEPAPPGSIGRPRGHHDPTLPPSEVRIVREDGTDADDGETGEILLRNATMMKGYFEDDARTREVLQDGWLRTGDLARRDADGWYHFVDRKKDVIRRRGENVSSLEVERVLTAHPLVRQAAVVGVPSELMDEDVLAFVDLVDGAALGAPELWGWTSERVADFKVPRFIEFNHDLPRTSTQKIAKADLRARAASSTGGRHDREAGR